MPVVLLVRHGHASFGAEDYDALSDVGREQSRVVGDELRRRALRDPVVVTGTLKRQRDTAALALPDAVPEVDVRLDEYDHLGLLRRYLPPGTEHDGTSRGVQVLLDQALHRWVSEGEDWPTFSGGANAAVAELLARLGRGRDAVVVTSGGIIAAVSAQLLGLGADGVVALNRVTVNGAITKLVAGSSGTSLVTFNEHAHLDEVTYR